jgi:hypothetical protein
MYKAMISTISSLALAGFFLLGSNGLAVAQSASTMPSQSTTHSHMNKGHSTSITGCLEKGDEANEYSMKTSNGKTYGLTSKKVQLSDHVGHKVMLRGYITPESAEGSEPKESSTAEKGGDIDMTVTSLKMISTTCQMQ